MHNRLEYTALVGLGGLPDYIIGKISASLVLTLWDCSVLYEVLQSSQMKITVGKKAGSCWSQTGRRQWIWDNSWCPGQLGSWHSTGSTRHKFHHLPCLYGSSWITLQATVCNPKHVLHALPVHKLCISEENKNCMCTEREVVCKKDSTLHTNHLQHTN